MRTASTYTVVKGDSLYAIARRFNMSIDELKTLNRLGSTALSIGQRLQVMVEAPTGSTGSGFGGSTASASYTVVRGDTLSAIARRFNISVDALKSLNRLSSNSLSIGQRLQVPGGSGSSGGSQNPPPPPPVNQDPTPALDVYSARRQFIVEVRPDIGCNRYLMTVPLLDGRQVVAQMRDNVTLSRYMVFPQGILYPGQAVFPLEVGLIESVGLTPPQARALQYVSTHEGKYDAINSYDKGIFSYGFVQFVGASESGASLNRVLESMKGYAPSQFSRIFQRVGINSEGGQTTVINDTGGKLRGDDAWMYIQRTVRLYAPFIQAGFEPILVREQLRVANLQYIQPALNFKLNLNINGIALRIPRLQDIISSEALLTAVIAIAVSRGVGGMSIIVGDAIAAVAAQRKLQDPAALKRVDERQVCETIVAQATDERVLNRAQGVLNSGLSFAKA